MTIRVLVVDDQQLVRIGLCGIVDSAEDITVVGAAATGVEAVAMARRHRPDVVLMDIRMPGMDGLDATGLITAETTSRILILTTFDLDEYVYTALRAGASGFLLKDTPPLDLLSAVRVVANGDALLAPSVTRRLIDEFAARPSRRKSVDLRGITSRERQVLGLVAEGLANAEIAQTLSIGPGTVKTHIRGLLTKLNARDRVHLVIIAYQAGIASR
ncbi:response regulator [Actinocrispum wychmicini]|uniref:DNA-binding NarL/FixJ family response regulator n=1 Tax=Actinocrispum wychmicini TaxID=1213861 RepID=A0A4R2ILT8_9PSEU|nr:response regulator transcription factor [Actinocrispum wychmicini]TCO45286.1 DNA-binding NarL/FixJ family response regulator [Actinocrispum wychmicini]